MKHIVLAMSITLLPMPILRANEARPPERVTVKNQHSPYAKLKSVGLSSVRWTDGFWADRFAQAHDVTLRKLWELASDPDAGHVLDNMRIAGGLMGGEFAGTNWQDAWLYKWIESAAAFYAMTGDPWIERRMDEAIELIAAAQEDDGYISTHQGPGIAGTDLIQDRTPLRKSREVVGHNVFFTYLYAGAADIYLENGDPTLWAPLERLWRDLTERKMCINGGVSPMGRGLSKGNDPVCEAVGQSYFLPCADCYNETCGQIGNLMWNYRMLCAAPDAKYADLTELELYNGFSAGISLDGDTIDSLFRLGKPGTGSHERLVARDLEQVAA